MTDILRTPLTEQEIAFLAPMGTQFWTNYHTGSVHIAKRWWNGITPRRREGLTVILNHMRSNANA